MKLIKKTVCALALSALAMGQTMAKDKYVAYLFTYFTGNAPQD